MFYIGQIFGAISLIFLIISFQKNEKSTLLKYRILANITSALQYIFLKATMGFAMNIMTLIRNLVYKKFEKKVPTIYIILIVLSVLGVSLLSYNGPISLLPTMAVVLYSIFLSQRNLTVIRFVGVITCLMYVIYNIHVLAISGIISASIELILNVIAIFRFDIKLIKSK